MSRSYRVLALALVGVLVMVGLAQVIGHRDDAAPTDAAAVVDTGASTDTTLAAAQASGDTQAVTDEADGDVVTTSTTAPPQTGDCTVTAAMKVGATGDEVSCLQSQLMKAGLLTTASGTFDDATDQAVRAYQTSKALEVDGIAGRQTAQSMGIWAGPEGPLPATDADCPSTSHGAIVDRANQRGALCADGKITYQFPITTAWSQPDPGTYPVYAKDMNASSNFGGHYSTMTHFVAFTKGKYKGARIAFHSVPKLSDGSWVMPLEAVGTEQYHGESSGCIRVLPDDAQKIWDWLSQGDEVRVIS